MSLPIDNGPGVMLKHMLCWVKVNADIAGEIYEHIIRFLPCDEIVDEKCIVQ